MESVNPPALLIEAFATAQGQGNGAAVVRLERPLETHRMQALAASLRQSETAFLLAVGERWLLRWFTPACEVDLCGHATLAALLALGHWGVLRPGAEVLFHSRSGALPACLDPTEPQRGTIALPAHNLITAPAPRGLDGLLAERTGASCQRFWTSSLGYQVALLPPGTGLEGLEDLGSELEGPLRRGLVVMAAVDGSDPRAPHALGLQADYQLRFFAPDLGIPEDPVTGSAHALVAPFWLEQTGKGAVLGWQPSTRAGGMLCRAASSGMIQVFGSGQLLWDGTLHLSPAMAGDAKLCATGAWAGWADLLPSD